MIKMYKTEQDKFFKNILKFTAPALAVFFTQLAMGVQWKAALLVAALTLYGLLADLFKRLEIE